MPNVVFFSFKEADKITVLNIKGRAMNSRYANLNFRVRDLLIRWETTDPSRIKAAISTKLNGTSRTIVFVGKDTHKSYWIPHEVKMTLDRDNPVYAMRLNGSSGAVPECLKENNIHVYDWNEAKLQDLATR